MIEYSFKMNFLCKLLRDTAQQPSAFALYFKILQKASTTTRTFMGREVIAGQMSYGCRMEPEVFDCSRKQWKRDKALLLDQHYITIESDNLVSVITVVDYNDILSFS